MAEVDRRTGVVTEPYNVMVRFVICEFCRKPGPKAENASLGHVINEASAAGFQSFASVGRDGRRVWLCGLCLDVVRNRRDKGKRGRRPLGIYERTHENAISILDGLLKPVISDRADVDGCFNSDRAMTYLREARGAFADMMEKAKAERRAAGEMTLSALRGIVADMSPGARAEFFGELMQGYCPDCGSTKGTRCHCEDER